MFKIIRIIPLTHLCTQIEYLVSPQPNQASLIWPITFPNNSEMRIDNDKYMHKTKAVIQNGSDTLDKFYLMLICETNVLRKRMSG